MSGEVEKVIQEQLPTGLDFEDGNWYVNGGAPNGSIDSASQITINGQFESVSNIDIMPAGGKYEVHIIGNTTSNNLQIRDSGASQTYIFGLSGDFDETFTIDASTIVGLRIRDYGTGSYPSVTTFSKMSIKKISGLIMAYNMIPTGADGHLLDISGGGNPTIVDTDVFPTLNGSWFNGVSSRAIFTRRNIYKTYTICYRVKPYDLTGFPLLANGSGTVNYQTLTGGTQLVQRVGTGGSANTLFTYNANEWINIVITRNGGIDTMVYINGVGYSQALEADADFTIRDLGSRGTSSYAHGEMEQMEVYDYSWSAEQAIAWHNKYAKRPVLIEDFRYDPVGATVPREWFDGTGAYEVKELSIARGDVLSGWDFTSDWTTLGSATIDDADSFTTTAAAGIRRNNIITAGKHYKCRIAGISTQTPFYVKSYGNIATYKTVSPATSAFDETFYFTAIDVGVYLRTNSAGGVNITTLELEEVEPLPGFKSGTKYLECTSGGDVAMPSKTAHGQWEFDVYSDADNTIIDFISSQNTIGAGQGYRFYIKTTTGASSHYIELQRRDPAYSQIFRTAYGYLTADTWYRIKITVTRDGVFTVSIKGGEFGTEYVLVDTTGGQGTNPSTDTTYSTSEFMVADFDIGDKITNIEVFDHIPQ
jgi:hypothetical protein